MKSSLLTDIAEFKRVIELFYNEIYEAYVSQDSAKLKAYLYEDYTIQILPNQYLKSEIKDTVLSADRIKLIKTPCYYGEFTNSKIQGDGDKLDGFLLCPPLITTEYKPHQQVKVVPLALFETLDQAEADPKLLLLAFDYLPYYFLDILKVDGLNYLAPHNAPCHLINAMAEIRTYLEVYKVSGIQNYKLKSYVTGCETFDYANKYLIQNLKIIK